MYSAVMHCLVLIIDDDPTHCCEAPDAARHVWGLIGVHRCLIRPNVYCDFSRFELYVVSIQQLNREQRMLARKFKERVHGWWV